jgi:hypothetical protein
LSIATTDAKSRTVDRGFDESAIGKWVVRIVISGGDGDRAASSPSMPLAAIASDHPAAGQPQIGRSGIPYRSISKLARRSPRIGFALALASVANRSSWVARIARGRAFSQVKNHIASGRSHSRDWLEEFDTCRGTILAMPLKLNNVI